MAAHGNGTTDLLAPPMEKHGKAGPKGFLYLVTYYTMLCYTAILCYTLTLFGFHSKSTPSRFQV